MVTIIAFILTILGSINWLLIGLLQYDFVAGIFGYQGSVFSRLIYIIIGAACVMLVVKLIKGKGTIAVFSRRNKKDLQKQISKIGNKQAKPQANIESSHENTPNFDDESHFGNSLESFAPPEEEHTSHGLLDEEIKD